MVEVLVAVEMPSEVRRRIDRGAGAEIGDAILLVLRQEANTESRH
jgi:hypothetical protein